MTEMACLAGKSEFHMYKILTTQRLSGKLYQIMIILKLLHISKGQHYLKFKRF